MVFTDLYEIQREFTEYSHRPHEVFEGIEAQRIARLARNIGWYRWLGPKQRTDRVIKKRAYRAAKRITKKVVPKVTNAAKEPHPHYTVVTRAERYGRQRDYLDRPLRSAACKRR